MALVFCAARAEPNQPPTGPLLDFTLKYLNNALRDGSIVLSGTSGTVLDFSYQETLWNGKFDEHQTVSLLTPNLWAEQGTIYCPTNTVGKPVNCVLMQGTVVEETDAGQNHGVVLGMRGNPIHVSSWTPHWLNTSDPYKQKNIGNALTHLIKLVKFQYEIQNAAKLKRLEQENQDDPFSASQ